VLGLDRVLNEAILWETALPILVGYGCERQGYLRQPMMARIERRDWRKSVQRSRLEAKNLVSSRTRAYNFHTLSSVGRLWRVDETETELRDSAYLKPISLAQPLA